MRELGLAHKSDFDAGSFTDKRSLATQIVSIIRGLDPPGRFLRHAKTLIFEERNASEWEELDLESSIIKACQVMRDISRLDRKDRDERRMLRKQCAKIECQVAERAQRADTDIVDLNDYQVDCASEYGLDESDVVETAN